MAALSLASLPAAAYGGSENRKPPPPSSPTAQAKASSSQPADTYQVFLLCEAQDACSGGCGGRPGKSMSSAHFL